MITLALMLILRRIFEHTESYRSSSSPKTYFGSYLLHVTFRRKSAYIMSTDPPKYQVEDVLNKKKPPPQILDLKNTKYGPFFPFAVLLISKL